MHRLGLGEELRRFSLARSAAHVRRLRADARSDARRRARRVVAGADSISATRPGPRDRPRTRSSCRSPTSKFAGSKGGLRLSSRATSRDDRRSSFTKGFILRAAAARELNNTVTCSPRATPASCNSTCRPRAKCSCCRSRRFATSRTTTKARGDRGRVSRPRRARAVRYDLLVLDPVRPRARSRGAQGSSGARRSPRSGRTCACCSAVACSPSRTAR